MKKITDKETLQAAVQEFYETVRAAMVEHQTKPFPVRRQLDRTWQLAARAVRMYGVTVEPLPIPKSTVQGAPVLSTPESKKPKAVQAPPPAGDVLADNAPQPKRRTRRTRKTSK